jgi:hypothetical protein
VALPGLRSLCPLPHTCAALCHRAAPLGLPLAFYSWASSLVRLTAGLAVRHVKTKSPAGNILERFRLFHLSVSSPPPPLARSLGGFRGRACPAGEEQKKQRKCRRQRQEEKKTKRTGKQAGRQRIVHLSLGVLFPHATLSFACPPGRRLVCDESHYPTASSPAAAAAAALNPPLCLADAHATGGPDAPPEMPDLGPRTREKHRPVPFRPLLFLPSLVLPATGAHVGREIGIWLFPCHDLIRACYPSKMERKPRHSPSRWLVGSTGARRVAWAVSPNTYPAKTLQARKEEKESRRKKGTSRATPCA